MSRYYIGADVHCNNTELVIEEKGQIIARHSVPTTIPAISRVLESIQGTKQLAFEEGPMAGWLYRNLCSKVDQLIVAEPRRNKLITSDGDKDDMIDSAKLARLLRGKFLKPVHHTDDNSLIIRKSLNNECNRGIDNLDIVYHVQCLGLG